jgi:hypothetical protein
MNEAVMSITPSEHQPQVFEEAVITLQTPLDGLQMIKSGR